MADRPESWSTASPPDSTTDTATTFPLAIIGLIGAATLLVLSVLFFTPTPPRKKPERVILGWKARPVPGSVTPLAKRPDRLLSNNDNNPNYDDDNEKGAKRYRLVVAQLRSSVPVPDPNQPGRYTAYSQWVAVDERRCGRLAGVDAAIWTDRGGYRDNNDDVNDQDGGDENDDDDDDDDGKCIVLTFPCQIQTETLAERIHVYRRALIHLLRHRRIEPEPRVRVVIPLARLTPPDLIASARSLLSSSSSSSSPSPSPSAHIQPGRSGIDSTVWIIDDGDNDVTPTTATATTTRRLGSECVPVPAVMIRAPPSGLPNPADDGAFSIADVDSDHPFDDTILPQLGYSLGLTNRVGLFLV